MSNLLIIGANGQIGLECLQKLNADIKIAVDNRKFSDKILSEQNIFNFTFDVTEFDAYKELVTFLDDQNIKLDKIVFCQGINYMHSFFDSNINDFKRTINVNFISVFLCLKILYEYFNDKVSIVVIASQNGVVGHEDRIDYGCSKASLIHLVKNLTLDFAKYSNKDIKINALSPSYVQSEANKKYFESLKGKMLKKRIPLNTLLNIQDVVNGVEFLLSERSQSMRGNNLLLDYGYTIK